MHELSELENKLGRSFKSKRLLRTALTHSSFANENKASGAVSNERLEFLGDSVLGMNAAEFLYREYPDMPEGRMTRLRAELVCEQCLVGVARELRLGDFLLLGKGEELSGGRERASILADAVEAVIAAIYLDSGASAAREFISSRILARAERSDAPFTDYKTRLQELVQRRSGQTLSYEMTGESGPDHNKLFTFDVLLNGRVVGVGRGRSKKEAEQEAARAAIEEFEG